MYILFIKLIIITYNIDLDNVYCNQTLNCGEYIFSFRHPVNVNVLNSIHNKQLVGYIPGLSAMSDSQSNELKFLYSEFNKILVINDVEIKSNRSYATKTKEGIRDG